MALHQAREAGGPRQTYAHLLGNMTTTLNKATAGGNANASAAGGGGGGGGLAGMLFGMMDMGGGGGGRREPQIPVLSCDKPMNLGTQLLM